MHSFFAEHDNISGDCIYLRGSVYNHIKNVLRLKTGEEIVVKSGDNMEYKCRIDSFGDGEVVCSILDGFEVDTQLPVKVSIFQGIPKSDKMELIIQKCVELGADRIIPVEMQRCVVKLDDKKKKSKCERWNTIALNASQQSKRSKLPEVLEPVSFNKALELAGAMDHIIVPYECAKGFEKTREVFSSIKKSDSIAVFIGPEGGFELSEIDKTVEAGGEIISLGKRILRTETAGIVALSMLTYVFEE